ncbi:MAG: family 16 glycosylhydrolase [Bacteroidales bacterium]|nr:family 16 glycosylhydrolase [Bacteroidales bacterium]
MGIFSFLFGGGKYPTTAKYEAQLAQKKADFERFTQIANSADLKRYEELKSKTSSADFKNRVDHLKNDRFSQTEEYKKEQELKALAKSSDIKGYLKFILAGDDKKAEQAINSAAYKEFVSLQKATDPEQQKRLKQLKSDPSVKTAVKMLASSAYANFKKTNGSDRLKKYESLQEYVKTEAFLAKKKDLENKNRFKESQEFRDLQELAQLEKSKDLKWYYANLKSATIADVNKWQLTFSDEFKGARLDAQKWMSGYYWGKKAANVNYSLADERQKFDEKNATVGSNGLTISTRASKTEGDVWAPMAGGFIKAQMDATAALINTGDSFRQKFGKFEFKVKVNGAKAPVTDNIWLSTERNQEINVATFGLGKGITLGVSNGGQSKVSTVDDVKYADDYYIYTLEWTASKLTWSVNGVEVYSTTANVPQEPMYIGLSSNVVGEGDIANADMNIEWVKVYAQK